VQNTEAFKKGQRGQARAIKFALDTTELIILLLSTVLVAPMINLCASSFHCIRDGGDWTDALTFNQHDTIHMSGAPHIMCWKGDHLKLVTALIILVPMFLFVLIPFAVTAGHAEYVPRATLYDPYIWREHNAWRAAALRKATTLHLDFLHPNPEHAFRTLLSETIAKVLLPIFTVLTREQALLQMVLVSMIGIGMLVHSIRYPPFVERSFCLTVQYVKFFTAGTMLVGLFTVIYNQPQSDLPIAMVCIFGTCTFLAWIAHIVFGPKGSKREVVHSIWVASPAEEGNEDVEA